MLPQAQAKRLYSYLSKFFMIILVHILQDLYILYIKPRNPSSIRSLYILFNYM